MSRDRDRREPNPVASSCRPGSRSRRAGHASWCRAENVSPEAWSHVTRTRCRRPCRSRRPRSRRSPHRRPLASAVRSPGRPGQVPSCRRPRRVKEPLADRLPAIRHGAGNRRRSEREDRARRGRADGGRVGIVLGIDCAGGVGDRRAGGARRLGRDRSRERQDRRRVRDDDVDLEGDRRGAGHAVAADAGDTSPCRCSQGRGSSACAS